MRSGNRDVKQGWYQCSSSNLVVQLRLVRDKYVPPVKVKVRLQRILSIFVRLASTMVEHCALGSTFLFFSSLCGSDVREAHNW